MKKLFLASVVCLTAFVSCKVDFSPNAEWKDVPVVWCLLDQFDDTTWVRVQRCYLGSDNLYNYTQISDSIYYGQDEITVSIEKWRGKLGSDYSLTVEGDTPVDTKVFTYTVRDGKDTGLFAGGAQPVYYAPTFGWLNPDYVYKLVVKNNNTGETVATATTQLVGKLIDKPTLELSALDKPNPLVPSDREFRFSGGECDMEWKTLMRARRYEPVVRFYYYHGSFNANNDFVYDKTKKYYVDVKVGAVTQSGNSSKIETKVGESSYFANIKNAIIESGDTEQKGFCDTVDILMNVCNEDLNAYIKSTEPVNTIVQNRLAYSNINDGKGVGIFAARRTPHELSDGSKSLIFTLPTPNQTGSGTYHGHLQALGVGF